jgi:hypothetical protein
MPDQTSPTLTDAERAAARHVRSRCPNPNARSSEAVVEAWQNFTGEHAEHRERMGDHAGPPHARVTVEHSCGWSVSFAAGPMSWTYLADTVNDHFRGPEDARGSDLIAPEQVLAALDVLGWPDDRDRPAHIEDDGSEVVSKGTYWGIVIDILRAADEARSESAADRSLNDGVTIERPNELADLRERMAALAALEEYIGEGCENASHNIRNVLNGSDDPRPDADRYGLNWRTAGAEVTA